MFAGTSGTGKTLAAKILAAELEMDIYRVDLAAVVNKYMGETEKNLNRLFSIAEEFNVVLLLDEADALFGKRKQVSDTDDRYANIDTDYLLQRIEEYKGLIIFATNSRQSLDKAFVRRMQFVVEFPIGVYGRS